MTPGIKTNARRVTVRGNDIGDVPTKYTMTGLEPYEIPVVGTFVDPRIVPGFYYRVRPTDRKDHLFGGRTLKLQNIGIGYAKRLTFTPDSLMNPNNYFWSDNHPDGVALETRAVRTGMRFLIIADDQSLGEACVFRTDRPQREERQELVSITIFNFLEKTCICSSSSITIIFFSSHQLKNEDIFHIFYSEPNRICVISAVTHPTTNQA